MYVLCIACSTILFLTWGCCVAGDNEVTGSVTHLAARAAWEEARAAWLVAQQAAETALHVALDARAGWFSARAAAIEAKRLGWVAQKAARAEGSPVQGGEADARALWAAERAEKAAWAAWDHARNSWLEETVD